MSPRESPDAAGVLRTLLATCRQAEQQFRAAAEGVQDPTLKRLFQTYSEQRAGFARELRGELASVGDEGIKPESGASGRDSGGLGRSGALRWADEAAVMAEREQGEQDSLAAYAKAVRRRLPGSAGRLVERQHLQVKDAHRHVRSLERSLAGLA